MIGSACFMLACRCLRISAVGRAMHDCANYDGPSLRETRRSCPPRMTSEEINLFECLSKPRKVCSLLTRLLL